MGYQRETAARGSMGQYIQLLFAGILEYIFFDTVPSTLSLIGTAIIMASAIYVIVRFVVKSISCLSNFSSSFLNITRRRNLKRLGLESQTPPLKKASCILTRRTGWLDLQTRAQVIVLRIVWTWRKSWRCHLREVYALYIYQMRLHRLYQGRTNTVILVDTKLASCNNTFPSLLSKLLVCIQVTYILLHGKFWIALKSKNGSQKSFFAA